MAPILLLLPLLLVLEFAAPAAATATTPAAICRTSYYPALCNKLIQTYHPKSVQDMLNAALTDAIAQLKDAQAKNEALSRKLGHNSDYGKNTVSCAKQYADAADSLEKDVPGFIKSGDGGSVAAYASAVSSTFGSCYDLFDVNGDFGGEMKFPGSDVYNHMKEVATNLNTVVCAAYPGHCA